MAATETLPRSEPAPRLRTLLDVVLVAGIVAVLLFPILAKLAADRLPRDAPPRDSQIAAWPAEFPPPTTATRVAPERCASGGPAA